MHFIKVSFGKVSLGDVFTGTIHTRKRQRIKKNHSALHLLQFALRKVLGTHITQRGSYAGDDYARFDFTHNGKISYEEIQTLETLVNDEIAAGYPLQIEVLPIEQARKTGAIAPFDETYGELVRVVTLGPNSKEFCGGTHVENTQDIGVFTIISEESIAAGTRRMTIKTSTAAYIALKQREKMLHHVQETLQAKSPVEVRDRLQVVMNEKDNLKLQTNHLLDQLANQESQVALAGKEMYQGQRWVIRVLKKTNKDMLTRIADRLKSDVDAMVLVGEDDGTYPLLISFNTKKLSPSLLAGQFMKLLTSKLGGSGGGRPEQAFGALKSIDRFLETVQELRDASK
jgi:alanyl-tRNA synthetase